MCIRDRFLIFGEDAENTSVGTVDEGFILVGEGREMCIRDRECRGMR